MKKIKSIEFIGIRPTYSTNVEENGNYISEGGVVNENCVIDFLYDGELRINLHNITGNGIEKIEPFQKIAQLVLLPKPKYVWEESLVDDLNQNSQRGEKGFGSSGKF